MHGGKGVANQFCFGKIYCSIILYLLVVSRTYLRYGFWSDIMLVSILLHLESLPRGGVGEGGDYEYVITAKGSQPQLALVDH